MEISDIYSFTNIPYLQANSTKNNPNFQYNFAHKNSRDTGNGFLGKRLSVGENKEKEK